MALFDDRILLSFGYDIFPIKVTVFFYLVFLQAIQMSLVAKEKNIHRALVTCSIKNPTSRAVILANGGQLEDIRHETERYWIDLE